MYMVRDPEAHGLGGGGYSGISGKKSWARYPGSHLDYKVGGDGPEPQTGSSEVSGMEGSRLRGRCLGQEHKCCSNGEGGEPLENAPLQGEYTVPHISCNKTILYSAMLFVSAFYHIRVHKVQKQ